MIVDEPGHSYRLKHLDGQGFERVTFAKRSSRMIDYGGDEHPGTNTQELFRLIIDLGKIGENRTEYLNGIQRCLETSDAAEFVRMGIDNFRMALYLFEVRALRRKREKLNREAEKHEDEGSLNVYRDGYKDIPFSHEGIEERPVGDDGHLIL